MEKKKVIVAVYTGRGLSEPLGALIREKLPHFEQVTLLYETLIGDCVRAGGVTPEVRSKLLACYRCAVELDAAVILNTCSSVGGVADEAQALFDIPIVRIDGAMANAAAMNYRRVAVVATLPTTLDPTARLISRKAAEAGRAVEIVNGLAEGAYDALVAGDGGRHDELIKSRVAALAAQGADCIVLAQASMMRIQKELSELSDIPVLASPGPCLEEIAAMFPQGN